MQRVVLVVALIAAVLCATVTARVDRRHNSRATPVAAAPRHHTSSAVDVRGGLAIDTKTWVGAEYTPARASNEMWWWDFDSYVDDVRFELRVAADKFGFTVVRMFLHSMLFEADKAKLIKNMDTFIGICADLNIKPGFVFFDDCWNHSGANLSAPCVQVKGRHNGCWMASPQDVDRTTVERYKPYVTELISAFANDSRVLYWEIFNEPGNTDYTAQLKAAAMKWAYAVHPIAPIMSCWDDNAYSNLVDVHRYTSDFVDLSNAVFQTPSKGGVVTEAGARWTAGGSVKEYINFLTVCSKNTSACPFVPGIFTQWELLLGNSNTRWHWGSADNAAEPTLGFHGHYFPSGTPVSYTEMSLLKRHALAMQGKTYEPFYYVNTFLTPVATLQANEVLMLNGTATHVFDDAPESMADGIYEVQLAPYDATSSVSLVLFAADDGATGLQATVNGAGKLVFSQIEKGSSPVTLATFDASKLECGVATDSTVAGYWNVLRLVVQNSKVQVYFNTMWTDVPERTSVLAPRVSFSLPSTLTAEGGLAVQSTAKGGRFDYVSVQPLSVL